MSNKHFRYEIKGDRQAPLSTACVVQQWQAEIDRRSQRTRKFRYYRPLYVCVEIGKKESKKDKVESAKLDHL